MTVVLDTCRKDTKKLTVILTSYVGTANPPSTILSSALNTTSPTTLTTITKNHPVYYQHYIDCSVIEEDTSYTQITFHSIERLWELPQEWRNKEFKKRELRHNLGKGMKQKGKQILDYRWE